MYNEYDCCYAASYAQVYFTQASLRFVIGVQLTVPVRADVIASLPRIGAQFTIVTVSSFLELSEHPCIVY